MYLADLCAEDEMSLRTILARLSRLEAQNLRLEDESAQLRAEVAKLKVAYARVSQNSPASIDQENVCPEGAHPAFPFVSGPEMTGQRAGMPYRCNRAGWL